MKSILLVDESKHFRNYLTDVLEGSHLRVIRGRNGFDGLVKLKSNPPDMIIMDYYLSKVTCMEFLREKEAIREIASIPVIIISSHLDEEKRTELKNAQVNAVLTKPLNLGRLFEELSKDLGIKIKKDKTPCIMDAHFNENILFLEVAEGLNIDKIGLLRYKIAELIDLYNVHSPRVLLMISNFDCKEGDKQKLDTLLNIIFEYSKVISKNIKIITKSDFILEYIGSHKNYNINKISVSNNLQKAMEALDKKGHTGAGIDPMNQDILSPGTPKKKGDETIRLDYNLPDLQGRVRQDTGISPNIVVVDDDLVVRNLVRNTFSSIGWQVDAFANGTMFSIQTNITGYDLLFLDLVMPEMDGFGVLHFLKMKNIHIPTIVLSAVTQRSAVIQAINLGVKSFLIKPIKPQKLFLKAAEIINMKV